MFQGRRPRIILGLSGSVAVVKVYELAESLSQFADVKVVHTQASTWFFDPELLETKLRENSLSSTTDIEEPSQSDLPSVGSKRVLCDQDEWTTSWRLGDPVLHIELRKWADLLVLAPLSANTLAKIANGVCDNLLTSLIRAWDCTLHTDSLGRSYVKPIVACPAMNTQMYIHPLTEQHLQAARRIYSVRPSHPIMATPDVNENPNAFSSASTSSSTSSALADPLITRAEDSTSLHSTHISLYHTEQKHCHSSSSSSSSLTWKTLETLWTVVEPQSKRLACGDVGIGALATVPAIVEACRHRLMNPVPFCFSEPTVGGLERVASSPQSAPTTSQSSYWHWCLWPLKWVLNVNNNDTSPRHRKFLDAKLDSLMLGMGIGLMLGVCFQRNR